MQWLITVRQETDVEQLAHRLAEHGVEIDRSRRPVPFEGGEMVLTAQGPGQFPDVAQRLAEIVRVNPASKLKPFSSRAV